MLLILISLFVLCRSCQHMSDNPVDTCVPGYSNTSYYYKCDKKGNMWTYEYDSPNCRAKLVYNYSTTCTGLYSSCSCSGSPCKSAKYVESTCGENEQVNPIYTTYYVLDQCISGDSSYGTMYTCTGADSFDLLTYYNGNCTGISDSETISGFECIDGYEFVVNCSSYSSTSTTAGTGTTSSDTCQYYSMYAVDQCNVIEASYSAIFSCDAGSMWIHEYYNSNCSGVAILSSEIDCNDESNYISCSCNGSPCGSVEISESTCGATNLTFSVDAYFVVDQCLSDGDGSIKYTCDGANGVTIQTYSGSDCTGTSYSETVSGSGCIEGFQYQVGKCTSTYTTTSTTKFAPRQWATSFSFILLGALLCLQFI